jgi:hypothetical protein
MSHAVLSAEGTHNGKAAQAGTIGRVAFLQQPRRATGAPAPSPGVAWASASGYLA